MRFKNFFAIVAFMLGLFCLPAHGAAKYISTASLIPQKYAFLVIDTTSGTVLEQVNADKPRYPASLTKLMTIYLTFEALKYKKINFSSSLTASKHASAQQSMKLSLEPGEHITVHNLIKSLVVVSANDSAVVLAEKIGGSEKNFARLMTLKAQQLGMKNTNFANASGLYNPRQVTTARDMAKLMMAIRRDFPQYYHLLSLKNFSYKGVQYGAHTRLIKNYKWAKAAKTGFISQSGFNLVLNAKKNNKNLVAVVMGGRTAQRRDSFMKALLDKSFRAV